MAMEIALMASSALTQQCLRHIMCHYQGNVKHLEDMGHAVADIVTRNCARIPEDASPDPETGIPDSYVSDVAWYFRQECQRYFLLVLNDETAWADVWDLVYRRVIGYLRHYHHPEVLIHQHAPDLAQHCTALIWQKLRTYPFDCAFDSWVSAFVANEVKRFSSSTEIKRAAKVVSLDQPLAGGDELPLGEFIPDRDHEMQLENREMEMAIEGKLDALSPVQGEVIIRQLAGQDNEQIALALGKSRSAIYNIRNRALERLQALIAP